MRSGTDLSDRPLEVCFRAADFFLAGDFDEDAFFAEEPDLRPDYFLAGALE